VCAVRVREASVRFGIGCEEWHVVDSHSGAILRDVPGGRQDNLALERYLVPTDVRLAHHTITTRHTRVCARTARIRKSTSSN
jgi:hypothetical protein